MTKTWRNLLLTLLSVMLCACAVGPDYRATEVAAADERFQQQLNSADGAAGIRWWESLNDPQLSALIEKGLRQNKNLIAGAARLESARAARSQAHAAFWPAVSANTAYTRYEQSLESPGAIGQLVNAGLAERDGEFYSAGIDAQWELDLFGSVRRRNERAGANFEASQADYEGLILATVTEIASAYFEYLGAEARYATLEKNTALMAQSLELTRKKEALGLARSVDTLSAETQYYASNARIPELNAARVASLYRLGVLTGDTPAEIANSVRVVPLPSTPASVSAGAPADMLARRPDVRGSERRLAAATAAIGIAQAEFFPRLVLDANYGFEAVAASSIGDSTARKSGMVPFLSWSVFQGGRLRAQYASANAEAAAAAANYEHNVLGALAEAETMLANYQATRDSLLSLEAASRAAEQAADIARKLYQRGLIDFLAVLEAERRLTSVDDDTVAARARSLINLAALYKALGGGWQTALEASTGSSAK